MKFAVTAALFVAASAGEVMDTREMSRKEGNKACYRMGKEMDARRKMDFEKCIERFRTDPGRKLRRSGRSATSKSRRDERLQECKENLKRNEGTAI